MKYPLLLGFFFMSITAQAMKESSLPASTLLASTKEHAANKKALQEPLASFKRKKRANPYKSKITKAELTPLEERVAYGKAFIGNIDKVLHKNGFAEIEKTVLTEIRKNLAEADLANDEQFKSFFKYAKFGTLALKGIASEDLYNKQTYCLGRLCIMAAECTVHQRNKAIIMQFLTDGHAKTIQANNNGIPFLEASVD